VTQDPIHDRSARKAGANGSPMPRSASRLEGALAKSTSFFGRYRIVDEIGVGGMASVHLARMDGPGGFQKWAAIKRIHPHLMADESFVHMFLDEARIAARISHPNVATVFELGKQGSTYWIAMEYLHGEPLREVMRRTGEVGGPMPPEIASRVIADAAEGLHAAHELHGKDGEKLNLIHRDVTPHNLFVTYDGATKVVDFGIAKCGSRLSNTRAGTLKGKLAYMSPEQVHGEPIDRRTDIFALGVVLWELTTGRRLFRVESDLATLAKVRDCEVPRPSTIVTAYPIDLEKIVMRALSKNRAERFATAREFSRALQSLLLRRGLFIASDEVAGYVQFIFRERIRKREAHLRWAGNLAETVHAERIFGAPQNLAASTTPSLHTYVSDTQAAVIRVPLMPRPAAGIPPTSHPSWAPTVVRRPDTPQRTASAHGARDEESGDASDTLVTGRAREPYPFFAPARDPGRPAIPLPPHDAASIRPASALARRRVPSNPVRPTARPNRIPVWAAAAISGTLALLPAGGIFIVVSRALRPSTASSVGSAKAPTPRDPVPIHSSASAEATETAVIPPFVAPSASRVQDLGDCMVSPCAP
jgi:serine/threonine-protein kinase